jgi:hypothetical protein
MARLFMKNMKAWQIIKKVGNNQRNTNSYCVSQQSGYRYGHTEISRREKIIFRPKVNTILKEFPYPDVTVRTLLTHRSGMRNYAYFTEKKGSLGPTQNLNQSGHIDYYGH